MTSFVLIVLNIPDNALLDPDNLKDPILGTSSEELVILRHK